MGVQGLPHGTEVDSHRIEAAEVTPQPLQTSTVTTSRTSATSSFSSFSAHRLRALCPHQWSLPPKVRNVAVPVFSSTEISCT
jgi:hypothetical protein